MPASDAMAPEMMNPVSFTRTGRMPYADATVSESRMAEKERPTRVLLIRQAMANNLKAVVAQKLLKGLKKPRVPTNEIMIVNPIVKKLISEGEDAKIVDAIRIGYQEGMIDFTENLRILVERVDCDKATALSPVMRARAVAALTTKITGLP